MQPPAPPPPAPRLTQFRYTQDQDSIRRFQGTQLSESDEQWDRLVPEEACASLPEDEVKRQGVIFEIIKSGKEYLADLEVLQDVFLTPLFDVHLPIIDLEKQAQFRDEVFSNFDRILAHERHFLAALYERQREQHPVITSVTDIILDVVLAFREDYESYNKHYPLAEARHRRELEQNEAYRVFLSETEKNPRVRKRELTTFISRPCTRLPRLKVMLEQALEYTCEGHTDYETISLILGILADFLKSIQPGIQAAEARVRFFTLSENLVFRKTEIIDLDFDGENRTVILEGNVGRKEKANASSKERWVDSSAKLLDHYFILTEQWIDTDPVREVDTENSFSSSTHHPSTPSANPPEWTIEQVVEWARNEGFSEDICAKFQEYEITGDILLEFDVQLLKEIDILAFGKRMRIANAIQELRRPASITSSDAASIVPHRVALSFPNEGVNFRPIPLDFLRLGPSFVAPPVSHVFTPIHSMYPFVVFHAGNPRRYILYMSSQAERNRWKDVLEETKNLRDMWMDGNKLFGFNVIQDGLFRSRTMLVPSSTANEGFTGRIICATAFRRHERNFLAIATENGIYLGLRDNLDRSVQVLRLPNVTHMIALASHDCFVLIVEDTLHSYSLEPLASVALGQVPSKPVEQTMEILAPQHKGQVAFFRVGTFGDQDYLIYGTPGPVLTAIHTLLITQGAFQQRKGGTASLLVVASEVYFMSKNYAIVSKKAITLLDPGDSSSVITVPDFSESNSNAAMSALKSQCESARTLGIVDVGQHERLVIYDEHGCYVDIYGKPMRDCKWVRWEIKAKSFSYRHPHLLLFGVDFIDIRHAPTGQFKQMVEAKDIRLLDSIGIGGWEGSLFLEWRGSHNDEDGQSWALVEGLETGPL